MNREEIRVRSANMDDAEALLSIYAPYVKKTAITFEYDVPSIDEFQRRMKQIMIKYPYYVAELGNEIVGYAYLSPFVGRKAYDWAAEISIYIKENERGSGIGSTLYRAIEETAKAQHITNLNACIGYPEKDDEYLTKNSANYHAHMGYRMVGEFYKCGYKFGRWYNMVWMEKIIGDHPEKPEEIIPFPELDKQMISK